MLPPPERHCLVVALQVKCLSWVVRTFIACLVALSACGQVKGESIDASPPDENADIDSALIDALIDSAAITPEVTNVTIPAGVDAEGAKVTLMVSVHAAPNETLTVLLTSTLGAYAPATGMVTLDANGDGVFSTQFTSGNTAGAEMGTAVARNALNVDSPAKTFQFPVVALRRIGNPTQFTTAGSFGPSNLLGQTITIPTSGNLKKLGWITSTSTEMIKIGIYTNVGGAPGSLVASIPASTVAIGVNEVALATPIALAAGTYWFMANYSTTGGTYKDATTGITTKYISLPFGDALPTTFPSTHSTYTSNNFNYYVVLGQ